MRQSLVSWSPCFHIRPYEDTPENLFQRVTDPDQLPFIISVERRSRLERFIYDFFEISNGRSSRFSDGSFSVFYTANTLETAIKETTFHKARSLNEMGQSSILIDMQVLTLTLTATLDDIRGMHNQEEFRDLYSLDNYDISREFATERRTVFGSNGIVYNSVRAENDGECAAIYSSDALSDCNEHLRLCYEWNGSSINKIYPR